MYGNVPAWANLNEKVPPELIFPEANVTALPLSELIVCGRESKVSDQVTVSLTLMFVVMFLGALPHETVKVMPELMCTKAHNKTTAKPMFRFCDIGK